MICEHALEVDVSRREGGPNRLPRSGNLLFREREDAVEDESHAGPPVHEGFLARQVGSEDDPLRVGEKPVLRPRQAQPSHLRPHSLHEAVVPRVRGGDS